MDHGPSTMDLSPLLCSMSKSFGFPRKEKLKSRKRIEELFLHGQRFVQFPVRVTYRFFPAGEESSVQVGVTAAKKNFKKAVDRNRIKRLLREAWRLQKQGFLEQVKQKGLSGEIFFMYTDKTIAPFGTMMEAVNKSINRLQKAANAVNENPA
jgi:ribonuclease P protein component